MIEEAKVAENSLANANLTIEILDITAEQQAGKLCVICMDKAKDAIFYPCGHMCVCKPCGDRFREEAAH